MEQIKEEMLTVKEWAKRAGLKLHDYDGFTNIYEKLSGNETGDFFSNVSARFRDAGDLLCTRRGFEIGIGECSHELPEASQCERMSDVIPNFVETEINLRISAICGQLEYGRINPEEIKEAVEQLLEFIKIKAIARRKSIELNGEEKTADISQIDVSRFSKNQKKTILKHKGTVEELEVKLQDEIISKLENILSKKTIDMKKIPLEEIDIYRGLLHKSGRRTFEDGKNIEEEYMYIEIPGQKKEEFQIPYRVIDGKGMREGVAFDIETENGRIKGTMSKPKHEETKTTEEQKEEIEDDTEKSLQTIDAQVSTEQRENLFTRIKEFTKRIFRKSKDNNHEER